MDGKSVKEPSDSSPKQKPAWVLTAEGREVVGPWYMEHTCIGVHELADSNMRDGRHLRRRVCQASGVPSKEINPGGSSSAQGKKRVMSSEQKSGADGEAAAMVAKGVPNPRWCPSGLSKPQRCRLQKLRQEEIAAAREEASRDAWFNQVCPMTEPKRTWREKRLAKEEGDGG
jgi:hypothetical protein